MKRYYLLGFLAAALLAFHHRSLAQNEQPARSAGGPVRIVLVGDSTVCNYPSTHRSRGWGQFIEERFREGTVIVINLAVQGRSTKTFLKEGRWQKALAENPDFVLIQFGHNDSHAPSQPEATDAATDYKDFLRRFVEESRAIGAFPVLVTPMVRRTFDEHGTFTESVALPARSLLLYADAMKQVGVEQRVPVIDLHASSRALIEKLGPKECVRLASFDCTHWNEKGARAMADLVMKELPDAVPKLQHIRRNIDK
jgi:lysophospholipase L1-like esterase